MTAERSRSTPMHRPVAPGDNPVTVLLCLGRERFVDLRGLRMLLGTARRAASWARTGGTGAP